MVQGTFMDNERIRESKPCMVCARDPFLRESLEANIAESQEWLAEHPARAGDWPAVNNIKQMLSEGLDFASTVLDSVTGRRVAPAYANFRCLIERAHLTQYFFSPGEANWEYQSQARRQEALDRRMKQDIPGEKEWIKEYMEGIRIWNRQPDTEKPTPMRRHTAYGFDAGEMLPVMRGWYEAFSMHVHPTYKGEDDIGRALTDDEIALFIPNTHRLLCMISVAARGLAAAPGPSSEPGI